VTTVILAGGGLANSLIALRLATQRPELKLQLLEAGPALGGNHTWSFHDSDLEPGQLAWLRPLVEHSWPRHEVHFPGRRRVLEGSYHSLGSAHLHRVLSSLLGEQVECGAEIIGLSAHEVQLADGRCLQADLVVDGRGATGLGHMRLAWQKFLGQVVRLATPHGLEFPLLMDATVSQHDGYRFVYLLPFDRHRLLIEDTYYSDSPALEQSVLRERIDRYLSRRSWVVAEIEREETGVLPIVLDGNIDRFWAGAQNSVPRSGMRAALFHGTTGYSLPQAAVLADRLAALPDLASETVAPYVEACSRRHWRSQAFFRLLNRLLFEAAEPAERYRVLEHFYRLPEAVIGRFYAGRLRRFDALRILSGRPPVPVSRALKVMFGARSGQPAGQQS